MGSVWSSSASESVSDGTPQNFWQAIEGKDLTGKVYIVTGAYSGLGAASVKALLQAKATVVVAGRNPKAQADFVNGLVQQQPSAKYKNKNSYDSSLIDGSKTMDLGDLASVRDFAVYVNNTYPKIYCLINIAGVMNTPFGTTKDGFEIQMGTNVIGHFLLSKILAPKTERQVWLSSRGGTPSTGRKDVRRLHGYQQSKLGDILLARQFPKEFPNLEACSVHPGVVQTNLGQHLSFMDIWRFVYKMILDPRNADRPVSPEVGARTQVMCAVADNVVNGDYYAFGKLENTDLADAAKNDEDATNLYDYCDKATKDFQI